MPSRADATLIKDVAEAVSQLPSGKAVAILDALEMAGKLNPVPTYRDVRTSIRAIQRVLFDESAPYHTDLVGRIAPTAGGRGRKSAKPWPGNVGPVPITANVPAEWRTPEPLVPVEQAIQRNGFALPETERNLREMNSLVIKASRKVETAVGKGATSLVNEAEALRGTVTAQTAEIKRLQAENEFVKKELAAKQKTIDQLGTILQNLSGEGGKSVGMSR